MIRSILAVLAGIVAWFVVATVLNFLIRALLPGYAAAEPTMTFTLAMMSARLAAGIVSSVVAGFVCSIASRGNIAVLYMTAALLVLLFLPVHFKLWPKFPLWYHGFFLITLAPLVLLGGAVQRGAHKSSAVRPT
jgi:hypothetical protein